MVVCEVTSAIVLVVRRSVSLSVRGRSVKRVQQSSCSLSPRESTLQRSLSFAKIPLEAQINRSACIVPQRDASGLSLSLKSL